MRNRSCSDTILEEKVIFVGLLLFKVCICLWDVEIQLARCRQLQRRGTGGLARPTPLLWRRPLQSQNTRMMESHGLIVQGGFQCVIDSDVIVVCCVHWMEIGWNIIG